MTETVIKWRKGLGSKMATCMTNVEIGQFTKSIAGHDKDKLFVIIKIITQNIITYR